MPFAHSVFSQLATALFSRLKQVPRRTHFLLQRVVVVYPVASFSFLCWQKKSTRLHKKKGSFVNLTKMELCLKTFLVVICFGIVVAQKPNSVYRIFRDSLSRKILSAVSRQLERRSQCSSSTHCAPTECCVKSRIDASQIGFCSKRPSLGDYCGLSSDVMQCSCIRGTTCTKTPGVNISAKRKLAFTCQYIIMENAEIAERKR